MGNRGNVIFVAGETISPGVYLHWNGGPESGYSFLEELDRREVRADACYEAARFAQIVGEFFSSDSSGDGLSLGIYSAPLGAIDGEALSTLPTDPSDNGFYIVDRTGGEPVVRRFLMGETWEGPLVELTDGAVAKEQADWSEHPYRSALRETFNALRLYREAESVVSS